MLYADSRIIFSILLLSARTPTFCRVHHKEENSLDRKHMTNICIIQEKNSKISETRVEEGSTCTNTQNGTHS